MSDLRWVLLAAGLLILALVFWLTRREASGRRIVPLPLLRRRFPGLAAIDSPAPAEGTDSGRPRPGMADPVTGQRIVTVRLMARSEHTFAGEDLILALRETGLRHGRFGIFHRQDPADERRIVFSVASLVEPGTFDLTQLRTSRFPGISLFLLLPDVGDGVAAFDDMLATARVLAGKLEGELLDEQGSRLSVQRERYLREEVIQFQHKLAPL